jgi:hypothetical protein
MIYTLDEVIESGMPSYIPSSDPHAEYGDFLYYVYISSAVPYIESDDPTPQWIDDVNGEIEKRGFAIVDSYDKIVAPEDAPKDGWLHMDDCVCEDCCGAGVALYQNNCAIYGIGEDEDEAYEHAMQENQFDKDDIARIDKDLQKYSQFANDGEFCFITISRAVYDAVKKGGQPDIVPDENSIYILKSEL